MKNTFVMDSKLKTLMAVGLAATSWMAVASPDLSKLPAPAKKDGVTYEKDIRPILEASCVRCHGAERPKAGLRLDSLEGVLKGSREGKVIIAGQSEKSQLVLAVARVDEETAMPPKPRQRRGQGGPGPGGAPPGGVPPGGQGADQKAPQGAPGQGGGQKGGMANAPKPLTTEQVALIRAWVDQGAK
jgi:mono/diheme cytochrome c family protein